MIIPVHPVDWNPAWRVIPTHYMEERALLKISNADDLKVIAEIDDLTNERKRQERGEISIVPPADIDERTKDPFIMAPFAYRNPEGSRFSDGSHPVCYVAHEFETAIAETKHHTAEFMRRTKEGPMRLERRALRLHLVGKLHDIRKRKMPEVYSKTSYRAGQALARRLLKEDDSQGIVYDSVRHEGGECAAVFRPPVIKSCKPASDLIYDWDGKEIAKVHVLREFPGA